MSAERSAVIAVTPMVPATRLSSSRLGGDPAWAGLADAPNARQRRVMTRRVRSSVKRLIVWFVPVNYWTTVPGNCPASNLARAWPAAHRRVDGFHPRQNGCYRAVVTVSNDAGATTNDGGPLMGPAGNGGHEPATALAWQTTPTAVGQWAPCGVVVAVGVGQRAPSAHRGPCRWAAASPCRQTGQRWASYPPLSSCPCSALTALRW